MTATPIFAGSPPADPAPAKAPASQLAALNDADRALNDIVFRARAVLSIMERSDLYDVAAAEGQEAYAVFMALEVLVKDIESNASRGIESVAAATRAQPAEVSHG